MNDPTKHIRQWKHNRDFAKTIDRKFVDWQVNAIFYTALHFVDAALVSLNLCPSDHSDRNRHVLSNILFAGVRKQYMNLYRISRVTRYDADPQAWLPPQYLTVADMVDDLLLPIENNLAPLIKGLPKSTPPLKVQE